MYRNQFLCLVVYFTSILRMVRCLFHWWDFCCRVQFREIFLFFRGDYFLCFSFVLFSAVHFQETQFLPGSGHIDTAIWMHYMDANKTAREETRWQLHKNAACNPQQVLAAAPHKTPTVRPPAPYHEIYSS